MSRPSQLGPAHLGSTSSSSSSTQSGGSGNAGRLADSMAHAHISHLAHAHLAHTHLGQSHHQHSHLSQSHHGKAAPPSRPFSQSEIRKSRAGACVPAGIGHLSLKRKGALGVAENGGSLRRSCEFGSDMLWPPPLESEGQSEVASPPRTRAAPSAAPVPPVGPLLRPPSHRAAFPSRPSAPENHSAPPDVTGYSSDSSHSHAERHHMSNMGTIARNTQKYGNAERMETGDGKRRLRVLQPRRRKQPVEGEMKIRDVNEGHFKWETFGFREKSGWAVCSCHSPG